MSQRFIMIFEIPVIVRVQDNSPVEALSQAHELLRQRFGDIPIVIDATNSNHNGIEPRVIDGANLNVRIERRSGIERRNHNRRR